MSLAKLLNLKRYDPAELKVVLKCTKCSLILKDSSYKRCPQCRRSQSMYMKSYRYDQQHSTDSISDNQIKKIDNDFEKFLAHISTNVHQDVMKLVFVTQIPHYLVPTDSSLDEKKRLIRIHYINRILAVVSYKFMLRSSCIKAGKLYLRYTCSKDTKLLRLKSSSTEADSSEKVSCDSKLSLIVDLSTSDLKLEFNHKYHV